MFTIILFFSILITAQNYDWFAGNGLVTTAYDIRNGVTEANCTTYDDCYNLLCVVDVGVLLMVDRESDSSLAQDF